MNCWEVLRVRWALKQWPLPLMTADDDALCTILAGDSIARNEAWPCKIAL